MTTDVLQYNSVTGKLLLSSDGKLQIRCCCNGTQCNCCCDPSVPAWYQSPLVINIAKVVASAQVDYDERILSCLEGLWVLPYGGGESACSWYNTFTAGVGTDAAVFSIYAEISKSTGSSNGSNNGSCMTLLITFESCKDCLGDILAKKPDILISLTSSSCNVNNGSWNDDSALSCNACGCSDEFQFKNIPGSTNYPAGNPIAYAGSCWQHPTVTSGSAYDADLVAYGAYTDAVIDVGHPLYGIDLNVLNNEYTFTRTDSCKWQPDSTAVSAGFVSDITGSGDSCGYSVDVDTPYLDLITASVPAGNTFTPVSGPVTFGVGCNTYDGVVNKVGTLTSDTSAYAPISVYVKFGLKPKVFNTCTQELKIEIPEVKCHNSSHNPDVCPCTPVDRFPEHSTTINQFAFPTAFNIATSLQPCGNFYSSTNYENKTICSCSIPDNIMCCIGVKPNKPPKTLKATDYAPINARYEVLYYIDGDVLSIVYIKKDVAPSDFATYPQGKWEIDDPYLPVLETDIFSGDFQYKCLGGATCEELNGSVLNNYIAILEGAVDPTTLHPNGIGATYITDMSELVWGIDIVAWDQLDGDVDGCCSTVWGGASCNTTCTLGDTYCGHAGCPSTGGCLIPVTPVFDHDTDDIARLATSAHTGGDLVTPYGIRLGFGNLCGCCELNYKIEEVALSAGEYRLKSGSYPSAPGAPVSYTASTKITRTRQFASMYRSSATAYSWLEFTDITIEHYKTSGIRLKISGDPGTEPFSAEWTVTTTSTYDKFGTSTYTVVTDGATSPYVAPTYFNSPAFLIYDCLTDYWGGPPDYGYNQYLGEQTDSTSITVKGQLYPQGCGNGNFTATIADYRYDYSTDFYGKLTGNLSYTATFSTAPANTFPVYSDGTSGSLTSDVYSCYGQTNPTACTQDGQYEAFANKYTLVGPGCIASSGDAHCTYMSATDVGVKAIFVFKYNDLTTKYKQLVDGGCGTCTHTVSVYLKDHNNKIYCVTGTLSPAVESRYVPADDTVAHGVPIVRYVSMVFNGTFVHNANGFPNNFSGSCYGQCFTVEKVKSCLTYTVRGGTTTDSLDMSKAVNKFYLFDFKYRLRDSSGSCNGVPNPPGFTHEFSHDADQTILNILEGLFGLESL